MIKRRVEDRIEDFYKNQRDKALLITGARQVGKTYSIRQFAKKNFDYVIEINFIENKSALELFKNVSDNKDILRRISLLTDVPMIPGKTIIFFDEVQELKEIVTAIKFLVEEGSYRYILSGSLLGVELKDIRSVPVGYMDVLEMYPLDFFEFCKAHKVSDEIFEELRQSFEMKKPIDSLIHEKMMELFRLYLIIGGMPAVVVTYLKTNNIKSAIEIQQGIIRLYKKDISKYDPDNKLYLEDIFNLIPSELNSKNKRFILKNLNENFKFSRYEHSFIWLREAGVALPTFCVQEPTLPLLLSKSTNLFKLFLSDVGLLASMYMNGIQIKFLQNEVNVNFGSIWENVVAQELKAHGFDLYYFNSKKQGEIDFIIEYENAVLPIEVKSGKSYTRHNAMNNILSNPVYGISKGFVFCEDNIHQDNNIIYYPIYLVGMLEKEQLSDYQYRIDVSVLQKNEV